MFKKNKNDIVDKGLKIIDKKIIKIKEKISFFYKLNFFLIVLISIILSYFLILVPLKPFSLKYVDDKINSSLQKNLDKNSSIAKSLISFSPYFTMKLEIIDFKLEKFDKNHDDNQIKIPKIYTEFSFVDLLFTQFIPKKIKISDANLVFFINENNEKLSKEILLNYIKSSAKFLIESKRGFDFQGDFDVENIKINFKENKKNDIKIIIKNAKIKTKNEKNLEIAISSLFTINDDLKNISFDNFCEIKNHSEIKCDLNLKNISTKDLNKICQDCQDLKNINTNLDIFLLFSIKNDFENLELKIESKNGDFHLENFFKERIFFQNLFFNVNYNFKKDVLDIKNIKSKLSTNNSEFTDFEMSYFLEGFLNNIEQKSKINIAIKQVNSSEIEKFWPLNISHQEIKDWVKNHIKEGFVKDAAVSFEAKKNAEEFVVENLKANFNFENLSVNYSNCFPQVSNIFGSASFSENSMNFDIKSGKILESEIVNSKVYIQDFANPILQIEANISGNASDGLKHANFQSSNYTNIVEKYLNGKSNGTIEIRLPMAENIDLKNSFIDIDLLVTDLKNEFLEGVVEIKTHKNINEEKFLANIDFKNAKINDNIFSVTKDKNDDANLNFEVDVSKKNEFAIKNAKLQIGPKILAFDLAFLINEEKLSSLNLSNNFGKNNYKLKYENKNLKKPKISLIGNSADLERLLAKKSNFENKKFNLSINSSLKKIYLIHQKNIKNFKLNLDCNNSICQSGQIFAQYSKENKQLINLLISKNDDKKYILSGNIFDVGYFAEIFNISDKISSGNAKIKIVQDEEKYEGEIKIKNNITFYESNLTKKLEKDDLFLKVKDKIFSNNKTIFDDVKINFTIKENFLFIDSFIANNYKIGITAKGNYDLKNEIFNFKGMIIPGFLINNLFGIGKIPLIGNVVNGLLTGGQGGGLFGIKYEYFKNSKKLEPTFKTYPVSAFVPVSIRNLFELI